MSDQQASQPSGERVVYERCLCREVLDHPTASALIQASMNANPEESAQKKDGIGAKAAGTTP